MIKINCDIGERGIDHPVDLALMDYIHIANIACGGHSGNPETVNAFRTLADKKRIEVSAHLSYPDPMNFGRASMEMPMDQLTASLNEQMALMPGVRVVKFHGGLYHDSCNRPNLADGLSRWLKKMNVETLIAPHGSEIMKACVNRGMDVLSEAFAERRYVYDPKDFRLSLMERIYPESSFDRCEDALRQCLTLIRYGFVEAYGAPGDKLTDIRKISLPCDTLCIHSDSKIALELGEALSKTLRNERPVHD